MSFLKVTLPAAVLTLTGLAVALVALERNADLPHKPSILLRSFAGDLPSSDLAGELARESARVEQAQRTAQAANAALAEHQKAGLALAALHDGLKARIEEKQAADWSGVPAVR